MLSKYESCMGFTNSSGLAEQSDLIVFNRLEEQGPFGNLSIQGNNRAELRAAIAALHLRRWSGEGFITMVIAPTPST